MKEHPDEAKYQVKLAATQGNLGQLYRTRRKPTEALQLFKKSLATLDATREDSPMKEAIGNELKPIWTMRSMP